jgi:2-polyprenyl-3-methyl-5-hydroxy-6-metoxy-1,4-benzoquinol methylase
MWVNHTRMLRFYVETFVPLLPDHAHVLEIGPGHGLLAAVLLGARPDVRYSGIDISPRSISYSADAFAAAGIAADRYDLAVADACDDPPLGTGDAFAGAVCCEVLEHVDEPITLLGALRRRVEPGAPAFLSTVANMEAEDHVFLFHDEEHIRSALRDGGFAVEADQPLDLAGFESATPRPVNYSAIVRAA